MLVALIVVLLVLLFVFLVKGRTGHKDLEALRGWYYAHRGLHKTGVPENSLAAFRAAKEAGYGISILFSAF